MDSLRLKATSGVRWTSLSTFIVLFVEFLRIAILTHLLVPKDFGLFGMIIVVLGFIQTFSDVGISNAIIYKQDATKEELSSLYWLTIISGILIFLLILLLTPMVVDFYNEPRLATLMPLAAVNFLIIPVGQQFGLLLQRDLKFKFLAVLEILSTISGMVVAIIAAYLGNGVYSIIWGSIACSFFGTSCLLYCGLKNYRPGLIFRLANLKGYLSFGLYQMGERCINYFSANVDYLFIGRYLGPDILGVYMIAYQLVVKPLMRINPILTKVAFPIFSKKQNDNEALKRGYLEIIKLLSFIIFPILIGLAVTSKLFIPVVYGERWGLAIPLVQILAIVGIIKTLGNPMGSVLLAKGRADIGFKWNVFVVAINILVFWIVVRYGVFAVAWAWVILVTIYFFLGWFILFKVIDLTLIRYLVVIKNPVLISIVMGTSVFVLSKLLMFLNLSSLSFLCLLVGSGAVIYLSQVFIFEYKYIRYILEMFLKGEGSKF